MTRSRDWWAAGGLAARAALALLEDLGEVGDLAGRRSFDLRGRAEVEQLHGGALQEGGRLARVVAGVLFEVAEVFARDLAQGRQVQLEPGLAGTGCSPRTRRYMLVPSM